MAKKSLKKNASVKKNAGSEAKGAAGSGGARAAALPAADMAIARHRAVELSENNELVSEISHSIFDYRKKIKKFGEDAISLANEARRIGILIGKHWDTLPGKTMTIDFWEKMQAQFADPKTGQPIALETLKWFVRIAQNNPEPIDSVPVAMSYRQQWLLGPGGFILEGECGRTQSPHEPPNAYVRLAQLFEVHQLEKTMDRLVSDPNYGPVESWPAERKEKVRLQVEPYKRQVDELYEKLSGAAPVEV